jgi:predicted AlkP superfamily pyrophosphatase or phosphodiesterase
MKPTPKEQRDDNMTRLRSLFAEGKLVHPYLSREFFQQQASSPPKNNTTDCTTLNFVDLAASLAICCGYTPPIDDAYEGDELAACTNIMISTLKKEDIQTRRLQLAAEVGGGSDILRQHIVFILCDGMGNSILRNTLHQQSFFNRNNQQQRLRAVFPSTTPAALTTLATATWPGRHGMPGWNLRDKKGCDFPGETDNNNNNKAHLPVQLLVLSDHIKDARSVKLASEMGFESWDEVFLEEPWAKHINNSSNDSNTKQEANKQRRMMYINAYNGDDYQEWSQGTNNYNQNETTKKRKYSDATDFSEWQMGNQTSSSNNHNHHSTLFETAKIEETAFDTLGEPKGSIDAIQYYRDGLNAALDLIAKAERVGESTFTYLYTAHPDKHMHALGVEHEEVRNTVMGIESETERFWRVLGDRDALLSGKYDVEQENSLLKNDVVDAAVVLTADHGHVTIQPEDMVVLPGYILELLEYACIGVHGKGRHGYLHCRAGLQKILQQRWEASDELHEHFLLLTIDEAIEIGLFGPKSMRMEVRPRLGDFLSISIGTKTLVTPSEKETFCKGSKCQGAHGSLNPEEMHIPFILLEPSSH